MKRKYSSRSVAAETEDDDEDEDYDDHKSAQYDEDTDELVGGRVSHDF